MTVRFSPSVNLSPLGTVSTFTRETSSFKTHGDPPDIKTNYVGIHIWDIPKDYNPGPGLVVSTSRQS